MQKIDVNFSLAKNLKEIKKEGRKWDIILLRILYELLIMAISILGLMGGNKLLGIEINWAVSLTTVFVLDTIETIRLMFKDYRERDNRVLDAKDDIRNLAYKINLIQEDAINLVPKITFDSIKDAIATKEKEEKEEYVPNTYGAEGYTKQITTEVTNFFLLDDEEKLRILREIRKLIKDNGTVKVESDLYLLENDDMPSYVPVVKSLERK